jgi:hypothetical protein
VLRDVAVPGRGSAAREHGDALPLDCVLAKHAPEHGNPVEKLVAHLADEGTGEQAPPLPRRLRNRRFVAARDELAPCRPSDDAW